MIAVINMIKMKRYISTWLMLFSVTASLFAQDELKLSLNQAKELGLKNRFDVKAHQFEVEITKEATKQKKDGYLPDFRLAGNINYHPQIQGTLIPPGFAGISEPTYLALGAKSISVFSLELHQTIYNPLLGTDIKISENAELLELEKKRELDIAIKKEISQSYLNALLRHLQVRIAENEQKRFSEYLTLAEGKFQNGALIENDYLRAKLDYENSQQQALTSNQEYELSLVSLRYVLNIAPDAKLLLTDSLDAADGLLAFTPEVSTVTNRTELRQLELQQQNDRLNEQRQRQTVLPTITLTGNYSQQYLNMDFNYNYTDSKWWSPFNSIGLQATFPLTGQFTNRTKMNQARLKSMQTTELQRQAQAKVNYELQSAVIEIRNASQSLARTKSSYQLAQRVMNNQKQQLDLGAFSYDSLLNTESSMTTAERNYITSTYEYLVAKLNYDFAAGTL